MRAIMIDPFTRKVSEIDTDASLDDLYRLLDVDLITVVQLGAKHAMILDDEGLLKDKSIQAYFTLLGAGQPFAGRGLILADEYGENRAASIPLSAVEQKVVWLENDEVEPDRWTGWEITVV